MLSLSKFLTLLSLIGTQVNTAPLPSEITVEPFEAGTIYGKCELDGHIFYDVYTILGINWPVEEADLIYAIEGRPDNANPPRMITHWQFEEKWENNIQTFAAKFRLPGSMNKNVARDLNRIKHLDMTCNFAK